MKHLSKEVSYPIAKLLQEKGYNAIAQQLWQFNGCRCEPMPNRNSENLGFSAPTVGEVVDWIYEKQGVWISVNIEVECFDFIINNPYGLGKYQQRFKSPIEAYESPYEAYEAAFEYFLNNLIEKK